MSHTMELKEGVLEARLTAEVSICEQQNGFVPRKSTIEIVFEQKLSIEMNCEGQNCIASSSVLRTQTMGSWGRNVVEGWETLLGGGCSRLIRNQP